MKISPERIYKYLDQHVSGQEEAKRVLSYAGFMHYLKNSVYFSEMSEKPVKKTVSLLTGPTGVGKTYLVSLLAEYLQVPFIDIDCTTITREGYVGESITDKLGKALDGLDSKDHIARSSTIVFLDEIDKISLGGDSQFKEWNSSLQASILKLIEGCEFSYYGGISEKYKKCSVTTHHVMFILAGNFPQLRETKRTIGFGDINAGDIFNSRHEKLINSGVTPELAGRLSLIGNLKTLKPSELRDILLNKPDSVWKQYERLLKNIGVAIDLQPEDIDTIVDNCIKNGTGARGLQTEVDRLLIPMLKDEEIEW